MTISNPKINIIVLPAAVKPEQEEHKILFIGQKSFGSADPLTLYKSIPNDNSWIDLFGAGSQLSLMINAAKEINNITRMDAIAFEDEIGSTLATGDILFAGTATENGTLTFIIGSYYDAKLEISVEIGDTANAIANKLSSAINNAANISVTGSVGTDDVLISAKNKGIDGNFITLEILGEVSGITYTLTGMSGGSGYPDLTLIEPIIENLRYNTIVFSGNWDFYNFSVFMESRLQTSNALLMGINFACKTDSVSNIATLIDGYSFSSLSFFANKPVNRTFYKGSSIREIDTVISSIIAAVRGLRLTDDADISRYVIARDGAKDARGGAHLSTKPYFNTPFPRLPVMYEQDEWTNSEQKQLSDAGVSILGNNASRNEIIASEFLTTYKFDVFGNQDYSFRYVNYRDATDTAVEYIFNSAREEWAQSRLTDGALVPLVAMANKKSISAAFDGWYADLAGSDFVVTRSGKNSEGKDPYKIFNDSKVITLDLENGKVTVSFLLPIVTQLREIDITMQLTFALAT